MESFADYILEEKNYLEKMEKVYYIHKKTGIFYDNSVLFKTELTRWFIETMKLEVDENFVLTACLLYGCKKSNDPRDLSKVKSYAKEGAEYLESLGFDKKFCKVCEEHNRYSGSEPREKESDILEVIDQFGGMLLHRPDRLAFTVEEAIQLLETRNMKDSDNRYLGTLKEFASIMEDIQDSYGVGSITLFQKEMNKIPMKDYQKGIEAVYHNEKRIRKDAIQTRKKLIHEKHSLKSGLDLMNKITEEIDDITQIN